MTRRITPQTNLDNLKKEAKRWLKELRANDTQAHERFERAFAKTSAPQSPALRDVQHALALEYGFSGWTKLKRMLESREAEVVRPEVHRFLEYACPDHHVRGRPSHRMARHAAMRLLEQHPDMVRDSIFTAVVCGEVDHVERFLRRHPHSANEKGGTKAWQPLLYLCFTRLPLDKANDNALTIARLLLDHGADPNVFFMAGNIRYTPLVGIIGEGEEDRPPHPHREALTRLLLERGANPFDIQVVYNIHFHGKVLWYMELMYEFSVKAGRKSDWEDPDWRMLDMGNYGTGARWHLSMAVENNDIQLAEWCLSHGANPDAVPARNADEEAFVAACLRLDTADAKRRLQQHPEYLRGERVMLAASRQDRADVARFLIGLGLPLEAEYQGKQRPLHIAAKHNAVRIAEFLIDSGAEIDPVEDNWHNTPIDFAVYHEHPRMIELLGRYTRNVGNLAFIGNVARLREVITAQPDLAKSNWGSTPLFWLPEDEKAALEIIDLFLANGADATFRQKDDGLTAADVARKRGLMKAARRLDYEQFARDLVMAYATGDPEAVRRINERQGWKLTVDDLRAIIWRTTYKVRQAKGAASAFGIPEAQDLVAHGAGFPNWTALTQSVATGASSPVPSYGVDAREKKIWPRRIPTRDEWDTIIGIMKEERITTFEANGLVTDEVLDRIAELDHVTSLSLGGARLLSDDGLLHLARMPQLEYLNLSEYPGGKLTDRGLEVLRHLPNLKTFEMTWQRGISDAGAANLKFCEKLENVSLMGSPTGDGAIEALRGKPRLHRLQTGRLVTDAALALLQDLPLFKRWHGDGAHLLIDGPFTNNGLAAISGLEGVFELDLFWHVTGITAEAFAALRQLPNLGSLGCDGDLSNDASMPHIAAIPKLQKLRAQGTTATDDGFIALSRSQTLEHFWGRECPNLTGRGFSALSKMPRLQFLGVSCKNVDDQALSTLPTFPSLRDLTPIDVQDDGFRHIGRCHRLDRLACMYCRDTTDAATEHTAGLQLKTYYAGLTKITDRSLQILGRMLSLESIEFYETKSVTDAGLRYLAGLPRLREIHIGGLPNVTLEGTKVFPPHVRVDYHL